MPQAIPVEASETTDFVPKCFADLESPPTFTLRACTTRDKRFQQRLINEEGVSRHSVEAIRAEMLAGLKLLWTEDDYAKHAPVLEAYWQASDDFALQSKDDPDLVWSYDAATEASCEQLELDVAKQHRKLAKMRADNVEASETAMLSTVAVAVRGWTGLDVDLDRERGYLTIDSTYRLRSALIKFDDRLGVTPGTSWAELLLACSRSLFLDEDQEKNSASPSPSEPLPPSSKTGEEVSGKSPASASSTETPASE